jgi:hypothetical protein
MVILTIFAFVMAELKQLLFQKPNVSRPAPVKRTSFRIVAPAAAVIGQVNH